MNIIPDCHENVDITNYYLCLHIGQLSMPIYVNLCKFQIIFNVPTQWTVPKSEEQNMVST